MIGLTIDPGLSTGACLFTYDKDKPLRVEKVFQFVHGAHGLAAFLNERNVNRHYNGTLQSVWGRIDTLVVERFTPRPNEGFGHTRGSTEPLRCEGVLIGRGLEPFIQWAEPSMQYFIGDQRIPLAEKKKQARAFLKEHDMLWTGRVVEQPDANDAVSATLHAIAWARRTRHMPTILDLFGEEES